MLPHLSERLASQRREELLREAAAHRRFRSEDRPSTIANNRAFLGYLLFGQSLPAGKQPEPGLLMDQARYRAALRMIGLLALALGVLAGSLLDSRFGLAPAVLVDGAVVAILAGLLVSRSIGLLRSRALRQ
jgi:hypothetical protein